MITHITQECSRKTEARPRSHKALAVAKVVRRIVIIGIFTLSLHKIIPGFVVQLDRMADSGSVGWRFESSRGHN